MSDNIRDLYRKKGQKLAKEKKNSADKSKTHLDSTLAKLDSIQSLSPEIELKMLQLRSKFKIPETIENEEDINLTKDSLNLEKLSIHILSFGLNYQRMYGHGLKNREDFIKVFNTARPHIKNLSVEILNKCMKFLSANKLLYSYNTDHEILFESPNSATDIHQILILAAKDGSLKLENLHIKLNWGKTRLESRLKLLEDSGLIILDNTTLWFPQLSE